MRLKSVWTLCIAGFLVTGVADAADKAAPRAEIFQKLIDCRAIKSDAERLACFETQAARIDAAEANKDVLVIDRSQATKARKEGFGLPAKPILGGGALPGEGITDVRSTIREARLLRSNKWFLVLSDGARWFQTELKTIRDPKPGQGIRIRKAALGSYIANIDGQPGVRVKRVDQP